MQQVLVAVLVALALLQLVRPQVGAQEIEDNHSTNSECGVLHMYCSTLRFTLFMCCVLSFPALETLFTGYDDVIRPQLCILAALRSTTTAV